METLYTSRLHGFPNLTGVHYAGSAAPEEGVLSLIVVLTTSVSLVALVFAFITYRYLEYIKPIRNELWGLLQSFGCEGYVFPGHVLSNVAHWMCNFAITRFLAQRPSQRGPKKEDPLLFSDLRNLMGTTLMTLLATTFMAQLIYVVGVGGVHDSGMCLAISHSLQFLHLCLLCWLLVLCKDTLANLTTDSPVPATMTRRQMCLKFALVSLWAWGGPAVQVAVSYYTGTRHPLPSMFKTNCWFIEKKLYLLFYGFPAMVLLCTCACLMVRARVRLTYSLSLETRPKHRAKLSKAKKIQVGLCSKLTFTLLTMDICGLAFVLTGHNVAWIGYNVIHSVQGLVMALCATCHSQVLSVYTRRHRRRRSSTRLLSKTSSLEDLDWSPLPSTV